MALVLITDKDKEQVKRVIRYAAENVISLERMERIGKGLEPPVRNNENNTVQLYGLAIVYTIDEQPQPLGECHHFSFSVPQRGFIPGLEVIQSVLTIFGLDIDVYDSLVHSTENPGVIEVVNVIYPVNGWPNGFSPKELMQKGP